LNVHAPPGIVVTPGVPTCVVNVANNAFVCAPTSSVKNPLYVPPYAGLGPAEIRVGDIAYDPVGDAGPVGPVLTCK